VLTRGSRPTAERRWRIAALGVAWLLLAAPSAVAQQRGPIQLFPDLETQTPAPTDAPPGRTVAPALPSGRSDAPSGFRVEGLAPPGVDAIGLAGPAEGGFDQNLWAGSDGEFILALLDGLPVATENPPLRALARRVLMTGAPVQGVAEPGSILGARAERLLAMGDLEGATALLDQVPSTENDSQIARLVVQAALLREDQETACARAADIAPSSDAAFWAEVTIYCRLADGDQEGARLALDLLRDQGQTDDAAFVALAESIAAGEPAAVPLGPGGRSALHVALYRLADLPLPDTALAAATPEVLAVAAREPRLVAGDPLAVAERAFLVGALSADGLAEQYRTAAPEQGEDVLGQIATAWGPRTRALAYNALPEQGMPERGQLLDALWRAAQGSERFVIAELFATPFAELPVERGRLRLAPSAARALLATERPIPASRWFSLLSADALGDPQARDDLVALTPLFALAGFGGSVAVPEFDSEAMTAWLASTPDAQARAGHLLALLEGMGVPVPDAAWHQLIVWGQEPMPAPPAPLWRALDRAAADRRLGESVLLALHLLGGQPEAAHPEAVVAGLRGLRAAGLDQEARAIAIATALEMGL
jgi:hypothetical protein